MGKPREIKFPFTYPRRVRSKNLLLIFFLLLVDGGLGDTVQVTLTALGDPSATFVLVNLNDTDLLESLEHFAVNLAGGVDVMLWFRTAVLGRSVDLAETANTDSLAEVDVTGDSSGANVEPEFNIRKSYGDGLESCRTSQRPEEGARWRRRSSRCRPILSPCQHLKTNFHAYCYLSCIMIDSNMQSSLAHK